MTPKYDVIKAELFTSIDEIRIYVLSMFNVSQPVINISSFTLGMCFTLAPDYVNFCACIHRSKNVRLTIPLHRNFECEILHHYREKLYYLIRKIFCIKISCYNSCLALFIEVYAVRIIRKKNCRGNAGNIFGSQHSLQWVLPQNAL